MRPQHTSHLRQGPFVVGVRQHEPAYHQIERCGLERQMFRRAAHERHSRVRLIAREQLSTGHTGLRRHVDTNPQGSAVVEERPQLLPGATPDVEDARD